jgi:hypothetical protein
MLKKYIYKNEYTFYNKGQHNNIFGTTKTQYNKDSFGGHNFWICDKKWRKHLYDKINPYSVKYILLFD